MNLNTHYYSFGSPINGRSVNAGTAYAYGFNGKRNDLETETQDYGARIYDPKLGRFLSVDPLQHNFPWWSPYHFSGNSPIQAVDLDGLEIYYAQDGTLIGKYGTNSDIMVINEDQLKTAKAEFSVYNDALKTNPDASNQYLAQSLLTDGSVSLDKYFVSKPDVTNNASLVKWSNPESYGNEIDHPNCFDAAEKQLNNAGENLSGGKINTKIDNDLQLKGNKPTLSENAIGGAIYIQTQLKKGKAVMIGVEVKWKDGTRYTANNTNVLTAHYLVINSSTVNGNGSVSFGYLDNAESTYGKNKDNQFELDKTTGAMKDSSPPPKALGSYNVTEVRKNK